MKVNIKIQQQISFQPISFNFLRSSFPARPFAAQTCLIRSCHTSIAIFYYTHKHTHAQAHLHAQAYNLLLIWFVLLPLRHSENAHQYKSSVCNELTRCCIHFR